MDYVLSRMQAMLSGFARAKEKEVIASPELEPPLQLPKIQVVMAKRPGSAIPVHLMVDGMSPDLLLFKTSAKLREGEALELESLLSGVGAVKLTGTVDWMLQSNVGLTGQVALRLDADQREKVTRFLALQRNRMRG